jgi:hypothetical protein
VRVEVGHDALDLLGRGAQVRERDRREVAQAPLRQVDRVDAADLGEAGQLRGQPARAGAELDDRAARLDPSLLEREPQLRRQLLALDEPRDVGRRVGVALDVLAKAELVGVGELRRRGAVAQRALDRGRPDRVRELARGQGASAATGSPSSRALS